MYASCWILTKIEHLTPSTPKSLNSSNRTSSIDLEQLEI
jgi:betaine lipid synthase